MLQPLRYELDSNVRRDAKGTALIGGSPFRVLRLGQAGARFVDSLLAGTVTDLASNRQGSALVRRLVDAGMIHPVVAEGGPVSSPPDWAVIVPVFNDAEGLGRLLDAIDALDIGTARPRVIVVDDGSSDPGAVQRIVAGRAVTLVRLPVNRGPAAARNRGLRVIGSRPGSGQSDGVEVGDIDGAAVIDGVEVGDIDGAAVIDGVEVVVFIDADVAPDPGAVATLLAHFADPAVVAVAPRVRAEGGDSLLDRYEAAASPLDMGHSARLVRPASPLTYVPTAMLAARVEAIGRVGGFDERLPVGEDVDLIWRLVDQGGHVRFEPRAGARHRNRRDWFGLLRQRHGYGRSAAMLDRRHPGRVVPFEIDPTGLAVLGLVIVGRPAALVGAAAVGAVEGVVLGRKLSGRVEEPASMAARLVGAWRLGQARWLGRAITRSWLPFVIAALPVSRRARRLLGAAIVIPAAVEWLERRPVIDPVRFVGLRLLDDAAYCSGVWRGAIRLRRAGPWLIRLRRAGRV